MKIHLTLISLCFIFLFSCSEKKSTAVKVITPQQQAYISGYTKGVISIKSPFGIFFQQEMPEAFQPGSELDRSFFSINPKTDGKMMVRNASSLEFISDEVLKSNTTYEISININKIFNPSEKVDDFVFEVQTLRQDFSIYTENLKSYEDDSNQKYKLTGQFISADYIELEKVESILKATQENKDLQISWEMGSSPTEFLFSIDHIIRHEEEESMVILEWDGKSIDVDTEGREEVIIPALNDFSIVSVAVNQLPEQYISITFTDPIKPGQDFEGMIYLEGREELRYDVIENTIKAYPVSRQAGDTKLYIEQHIFNHNGYQLKEGETHNISFSQVKPAVSFLGEGNILPNSNELILPLKAVNLKAIDITVFKIFANNISQFLQSNDMNDYWSLGYVGRPISKQRILLNEDPSLDLSQWNTFSIDLHPIIKDDPGAIYNIKISFKKEYSLYQCDADQAEEDLLLAANLDNELKDNSWSESTYYDNYYYPPGYDWDEENNPCHISYYNYDRWISKNILASNFGIIAKESENRTLAVYITDLLSTNPIEGAEVQILDVKKQEIGKGITNTEGMLEIPLNRNPYLLIVNQNKEWGYMKLNDGGSLSTSIFDVNGIRVEEGIKGFIYGERGVWRPGDTLFLTFILNDVENSIPDDHPVIFELRDPKNKIQKKIVKTAGVDGFYTFIVNTDSDALTGQWNASVQVGGAVFNKSIRIETIKPNRLKAKLDFGTDMLTSNLDNVTGNIKVNWLHGAVARNLRTNITLTLKQMKTAFEGYEDYQFYQSNKSGYTSSEQVIFDKELDENGEASFKPNISLQHQSTGMLKAHFMIRSFEESGEFSTNYFSIKYSPYPNYVGMKTPKGDGWGYLVTDKEHKIEIVSVDEFGNAVDLKNIKVTLFKSTWRWWFDVSYDSYGSYTSNYQKNIVNQQRVNTVNGKAAINLEVKYPNWGRYYLLIEEPNGHKTGKYIYFDWPEWVGRSRKSDPGDAGVLAFTADKEKYQIGETATLTFPSSGIGRALLSIESGTSILHSQWVIPSDDEKETRVEFTITERMTPNVYAHITLIQPHAQTANDLPIRLYGVIPIMVEDPASMLHPIINMPESIRPEEEFIIEVSEESRKDMTYTLAVVDDGLLDLTNYKTPDPWKSFFAKEALGVKTWDIYDLVLGAYGGKMEKLFAIGGGDDGDEEGEKKANRFKPVVMFLGPFSYDGGTNTHKIKMPKYVGSVRTMVIAGNGNAFGMADQTTPVKSPVMVLATLPRVLSPTEKVKLPVTVFAMDKNIKNVTVKIEANDMFSIEGSSRKTVTFDEPGDQVVTFDLSVTEKIGLGKVKVYAESGNEKAGYEIEIEIRSPNNVVYKTHEQMLMDGKNWEVDFDLPGVIGTNEASLEVSTFPPIDLDRMIRYLLQYPHGCTEQITSTVFWQLYLDEFTELEDNFLFTSEKYIKDGIQMISKRQLNNGGFTLWPDYFKATDWVTSYAGHFLLEAKQKGYYVPDSYINNWVTYQKDAAKTWRKEEKKFPGFYYGAHLNQAYRLFTLALANKPDMGSMNRFREEEGINVTSKWLLAASYKLAGKDKIAESIVNGLSTQIEAEANIYNHTYGSDLRDEALILTAMVILEKEKEASGQAMQIIDKMKNPYWKSTQTTSFCLYALSKFAAKQQLSGNELKFTYQINNGKTVEISSNRSIINIPLKINENQLNNIQLTNESGAALYSRISISGKPAIGKETYIEDRIILSATYRNLKGEAINIDSLEQGTDFIARIKVQLKSGNKDIHDVALSHIIPSGWEIINTRVADYETNNANDADYTDIRDDRVYRYFGLSDYSKTKTFEVRLNAAYKGTIYLPSISCEAMYDHSYFGQLKGKWVKVVDQKD